MIKKLRKKGFTIVELVIVIAVIAILAAILIPTFTNVVDKANAAKIQSELKSAYTQYVTEVSDDDDYNPDLELVFKYVNDKGELAYYVYKEGVYVLPETELGFINGLIPDDSDFFPLTYKAEEGIFYAVFNKSAVGTIVHGSHIIKPAVLADLGDFTTATDKVNYELSVVQNALNSTIIITGNVTKTVIDGETVPGFGTITIPSGVQSTKFALIAWMVGTEEHVWLIGDKTTVFSIAWGGNDYNIDVKDLVWL
jgi:prepilin-type N-terminal cleavage/methylation domain-containing protein